MSRLTACQSEAAALRSKGLRGDDLFEAMASNALAAKIKAREGRCPRCWHDRERRCICPLLPHAATNLNVRILILMHQKEYLSAGDDAKLLLAMLPERTDLFVFGRSGDLDRLEAELAIDPAHNLILWPCDQSISTDEYCAALPDETPWRRRKEHAVVDESAPLIRIVVLDGVYNHASQMLKTLRRRSPPSTMPSLVALLPTTLSVYHRAQKTYGKASDGLGRVCSVEAVALLLEELSPIGESSALTEALSKAVILNNDALQSEIAVRPVSGMQASATSGAGKRARRKGRPQQQPQPSEEVHATSPTPSPAAQWLHLDDPFELLGRSLGPPWMPLHDATPSEQQPTTATGWTLAPAKWQELEEGPYWVHSVLWCERPDDGGRVCLHRFEPISRDDTLLERLRKLALEDGATKAGDDEAALEDLSASNVNGHHSKRDVYARQEVVSTGLPDMLFDAVSRASRYEATTLQRETLPLASEPEAWFNVLPTSSEGGGGWNTLHTHPGCSYASAYFVDRGGDNEAAAADTLDATLSGKIVLLPTSPENLSDHHRVHVHFPPSSAEEEVEVVACPAAEPPMSEEAAARKRLRFLMVDPRPGSLVIFPSFLPHFVAPGSGSRERVSVAANF